jgi:hypothetical protein
VNHPQPKLYVISQFDLAEFGCPHCGSTEGGAFLSYGTCSLWGCEQCASECAVVEGTVKEIFQIKVRDTDIQDLIGNHPYKDKGFNDRMIGVEKFRWGICICGDRLRVPEVRDV